MQNSLEKKEYLRKYYLANKEKIKANHKEYYEANKEHLYLKTVEWKNSNPEKVKQYRNNWVELNKEKDLQSKRNWEKRNPQYTQAKNRRRRAIKQGNMYTPYTEAQVFDVYGINCHICNKTIDLTAPRKGGKPGWEFGLHIDHVVPIVSGGEDTIENVRPSHAICNLKKGSKMSFEPEIDEDLFDECICDEDECICDDYDEDALDEEELDDLFDDEDELEEEEE